MHKITGWLVIDISTCLVVGTFKNVTMCKEFENMLNRKMKHQKKKAKYMTVPKIKEV